MGYRPKDGGPAYPTQAKGRVGHGITSFHYEGMTLRDWFAGQALASLCNAYNDENHASDNAKIAYANADAMIAQREVLNG